MSRYILIQKLIDKINAQSYVEIGLGRGEHFQSIQCSKKYGVDPMFEDYNFTKGIRCKIKPTHRMTSDEFFKQNKETFDVIFIDGMHEASYVERDINNALDCLNEDGYIVCHDMNPRKEKHQVVPRISRGWNGDCWKAWVKIRSTNPNLYMCVVNVGRAGDAGCGVIRKGSQDLLDLSGMDLTWENLQANRKQWLNLINMREFNQVLICIK